MQGLDAVWEFAEHVRRYTVLPGHPAPTVAPALARAC